MKKILFISLALLLTNTGFSQTRKNFAYLGPFPYNAAIGVDHAVQLSRKQWSSGRLYFVVSPNVLWTGYSSNTIDPYLTSTFSQYQVGVPVHLRYEFAPSRIFLGSQPGKHDNDVAVFFDVGLSFNYILSAQLNEEINYRSSGLNYQYTFDGSITSSIENRFQANYLTINFGFRINRYLLILRHYEAFTETHYEDLSKNWGKPDGIESFFYNRYLVDPYYKQGTTILCLGYSF